MRWTMWWWWCFENRSLDNVLGRLYGPGDGKTFEGVIG
jgi:phospholipase C